MGCPQYVFLALYVSSAIFKTVEYTRNTRLTSGQATGMIFLHIAILCAAAWVLHMGGFW